MSRRRADGRLKRVGVGMGMDAVEELEGAHIGHERRRGCATVWRLKESDLS